MFSRVDLRHDRIQCNVQICMVPVRPQISSGSAKSNAISANRLRDSETCDIRPHQILGDSKAGLLCCRQYVPSELRLPGESINESNQPV